MSKIHQGILGAGKGKIGGVIMSSWKGIATIRSMPASVANPQTTGQTAQRNKFSAVVAVARLLLSELIATYWDPFSKMMSGYNLFIKRNIECFVGGVFATPADFIASRGILVGASGFECFASGGSHQLNAVWANNSGLGDALGTDKAVLVYYNATQNYWKTITSDVLRSAAGLMITENQIGVWDTIHAYLFFRRPDVSKISDSSYWTFDVDA